METKSNLEIRSWKEESYKPLIFSQDWQVAILNWEPGAEVEAVHRVERHVLTDEVFVLLRGSGALVIIDPDGVRVVNALQETVYNVTKSTWHTVIGSQDSSWLIVEKKNTHLGDTEYRPLSKEEMETFFKELPNWADRM